MAKSAKKPEAARRQGLDSGTRLLPTVNKLKATTKPTTGAAALPGPAAKASASGATADPNNAASGTKQSRMLALLISRGRNDRGDDAGHRLAAALGAWLFGQRGAQAP